MGQSEGSERGASPNDGTAPKSTDLSTKRLRLQGVGPEDAEEMAAALCDPALYRWIGGAPPTVAALRSQYKVWALAGSAPGVPVWRTWLLRLHDTGEAVGFVQATVPTGGREALLAWVVGTPWQHRGLAREAVAAVATLVRAEGAARLRATIAEGNVGSERVAAALGLELTGRLVDGERVWESADP